MPLPVVSLDEITRQAYQAYGEVTDFKNFQGNPMPAFDDLPPIIQRAWQAATGRALETGLYLALLFAVAPAGDSNLALRAGNVFTREDTEQ